ncbi:MAG: autotransporter-associated beta strand repeat-containing protein, partial [Verrucomicrobia bacterium]|nr:autotransporter-associated beta strand repeat-containing protein [Verrucomicrobiota bacterium]
MTIISESGSTVFYTTDGSNPNNTSPHGAVGSGLASVSIPVPTILTIKAYATNSGESDSAVFSATYHTYATPAVPTWINTAGGSWPVTANWSNTVVASGANLTADFSALTLAGDAIVTLDNSPTVGSLVFGDKGNLYNWEIDTGSSGTLTLAAANAPTITVVNRTATINTALAVKGTNALIKTGNGTLTLSGTGISYTGPTTVNAGTLAFMDNGNGNGNAPVTSVTLANNSALM